MRMILAGAALAVLAAGGAYAQPGKNNGNGNGDAKGPPATAEKRGQAERGPKGVSNGNGRARANLPATNRGNERAQADMTANKGLREKARVAHPNASGAAQAGTQARVGGNGVDLVRSGTTRLFRDRDRNRTAIDGCPPGLAKKGNGCLPPGQAGKRSAYYDGWNGYTYRPSLFGLTNYGPGRYRYDNGYLLRFGSDGGVAGYIPLLGGALAIGNTWPTRYESYALPDYYVDYYDLGPVSSYRYADNVIYRVDPGDAAIEAVAGLLTGDDFVVGQPVPSGYEVYNVPYAYRDRYYDTDESWYRYSDGYVYRVDPETRLIAAAIDLLV